MSHWTSESSVGCRWCCQTVRPAATPSYSEEPIMNTIKRVMLTCVVVAGELVAVPVLADERTADATAKEACIRACNECLQACRECLVGCEGEACRTSCLPCIEICRTCIALMEFDSPFADEMCEVCEAACEQCADDCLRCADDPGAKKCAEACKRRHDACEAMGH